MSRRHPSEVWRDLELAIDDHIKAQLHNAQQEVGRANEEARQERRLREESWREAHVHERLAAYRGRAQRAERVLEEIIAADVNPNLKARAQEVLALRRQDPNKVE